LIESCSQVKKAITQRSKCGCEPFKFFIIDLDDPIGTAIKLSDMRFAIPEIKTILKDHKAPVLKIIAIATARTSEYEALCEELEITFITKTGNEEKLKQIISFKVEKEQIITTNEQVTLVGTETEREGSNNVSQDK